MLWESVSAANVAYLSTFSKSSNVCSVDFGSEYNGATLLEDVAMLLRKPSRVAPTYESRASSRELAKAAASYGIDVDVDEDMVGTAEKVAVPVKANVIVTRKRSNSEAGDE